MEPIDNYFQQARDVTNGLGINHYRKGLLDKDWIATDTTQQNLYSLAQSLMQNDYNREMYQKYMEDISPAKQVQNYLAAGLNPNLFYGNISSGTPNSPLQQTAPAFQSGENRERMNRISSILGNINQVFQGVGQVISSIGGVQDFNHSMRLFPHQLNNERYRASIASDEAYFSQERFNAWNNYDTVFSSVDAFKKAYPETVPILAGIDENGNRSYVHPRFAFAFPDLVKQLGADAEKFNKYLNTKYLDDFLSGRNDLQDLNYKIKEKILNNQSVPELVTKIVQGAASGNINWQDVVTLILIKTLSSF